MSCVNQLSCAVLERERECYQLYAHPLLCFLAFYHLLFYRYATFYESTMLSLYHQLYLKNQVCRTMNMLTELPVKTSIFFYLYLSPPLSLSLSLSLSLPLSLSLSLFLPLSYLQEIEGQQQQIEKLSTESREENIVQVAEHTHSLILGSLYHTI